jgi:alkylation response protein AidB-like acyl-CoA dehydrogenase
MDFRFTPEQDAWRAEIRGWLTEKMRDAPEVAKTAWFAHLELPDEAYEFAIQLQRELADRGWLAIGWPKEYGGAGFGVVEQAIFREEMYRQRAPRVYGMGLHLVGPTLMIHGTEEQKRQFLPRIAKGEIAIWQCFTEPDGGSDLASLKTRAVRDGDEYVVTGSKIYVGSSHPVDYLYLLVRTDPDVEKHQGISAMLVDARSPGIRIDPLQTLAGSQKNIVFLEQVRVPAGNLVGEENRGWFLAMTTLGIERSGSGDVAGVHRTFEEFVQFCRDTSFNGRPLIEDPLVEQQLGELSQDLLVMRLLSLRNLSIQASGRRFSYETSQSALLMKTFLPKFARYALEISQSAGLIKSDSRWAAARGLVEMLQRYSLLTHGGGTPEIQKNVIARRGLGLPRGV